MAPPFLTDAYAPAPGARTLTLGGRSLLYAEDQQQLLELNETADLIWRSLAADGAVAAAARELGALGLPADRATTLVEDAVTQWLESGYLAPQTLDAMLGRAPDRTFALDELVVDVRLQGEAAEVLDPVFGHFRGVRGGGGQRRRLTIIAHGDRLLLYVERRLALATARDGWVAQVKAVLTELYLDAVETGFLTHGALLVKGGRTLLLSGEPGAGKTTLALALAAAGWRYGGDDIVRITPAGLASGVPFAAAVKAGSVDLLAGMWPGLAELPAWRRSDGQEARYLLPPLRVTGPLRPLDVIVSLARRPGGAAGATPLSSVDALGVVLGAACARRWRMTGEALSALARSLEKAACVRLGYGELVPAVRAIEEIVGVEAQAA